MHDHFPADIQDFVQAQLATGDYASEDDLVLHALRAFRELKTRHDALIDDLRKADQGPRHPLDTEATKAEARRRMGGGAAPD